MYMKSDLNTRSDVSANKSGYAAALSLAWDKN
jgi:hypothetical protein